MKKYPLTVNPFLKIANKKGTPKHKISPWDSQQNGSAIKPEGLRVKVKKEHYVWHLEVYIQFDLNLFDRWRDP